MYPCNLSGVFVFSFYLTQVDFVEVPLLSQSTDANVTIFPVQEQSLINVTWCAFQFLPVYVWKTEDRQKQMWV